MSKYEALRAQSQQEGPEYCLAHGAPLGACLECEVDYLKEEIRTRDEDLDLECEQAEDGERDRIVAWLEGLHRYWPLSLESLVADIKANKHRKS